MLFNLSQAADVSMCVLDMSGAVMRQLDRASQPAGWSSTWYFGHDTRGNLLSAGRYPVLITASNADGTATAGTMLMITAR
jgi:flagellar hook assembly protein FlgD